jgi:hypothetical protein
VEYYHLEENEKNDIFIKLVNYITDMGLDFDFIDSFGNPCGGFRATWFRDYAPEEIHDFVICHETQKYSSEEVKLLYEMVNTFYIQKETDNLVEWILEQLKYGVDNGYGGELSY